MNAKLNKRWLILGSLLLATLTAAVFVEDKDAESDATAPARERRAAAPSAEAPRSGAERKRSTPSEATLVVPEFPSFPDTAPAAEASEAAPSTTFSVKSWVITPPPPPPPPPSAPPLPFKYLGKIIDEGRYVVFLNQQNQNLVVREGERIGAYRVEEISGKRMTFLYEPLKQTQELEIGGEQ